MKVQRVLLLLVFVVVIFLAIIALFLYKSFAPGNQTPHDFGNNPSPTTNNGNPGIPPGTTNDGGSNSDQPVSTDTHTAIDDCIVLKASEAAGKEYERGSLLVTFESAMGYETALETVRLLTLTPDSSATAKTNFETYHWLPVSVPTGEEFKWQCLLDASEGVKRTNLNITFNLRQ